MRWGDRRFLESQTPMRDLFAIYNVLIKVLVRISDSVAGDSQILLRRFLYGRELRCFYIFSVCD